MESMQCDAVFNCFCCQKTTQEWQLIIFPAHKILIIAFVGSIHWQSKDFPNSILDFWEASIGFSLFTPAYMETFHSATLSFVPMKTSYFTPICLQERNISQVSFSLFLDCKALHCYSKSKQETRTSTQHLQSTSHFWCKLLQGHLPTSLDTYLLLQYKVKFKKMLIRLSKFSEQLGSNVVT